MERALAGLKGRPDALLLAGFLLALFVVEMPQTAARYWVNRAGIQLLQEDALAGWIPLSSDATLPLVDGRQVIAHVDRALAIAPASPSLSRKAALFYLFSGYPQRAIDSLRKLNAQTEGNALFTYWLAQAHYNAADPIHSAPLFASLAQRQEIHPLVRDFFARLARKEEVFRIALEVRASLRRGENLSALDQVARLPEADRTTWPLLLLEYEALRKSGRLSAAARVGSALAVPLWHADARLVDVTLPALELVLEDGVWSPQVVAGLIEALAWSDSTGELLHVSHLLAARYPEDEYVQETVAAMRARHIAPADRDKEPPSPTGSRFDITAAHLSALLALPAHQLQLSPSLIPNGDFALPLQRRHWWWGAWSAAGESPAAFVGGRDEVIGNPPPSLRITGLWPEPRGYAGFTVSPSTRPGSPALVFEANRCYSISFSYMTRLPQEEAGFVMLYLFKPGGVLPFFSRHQFPPTNGQWETAVTVGCNLGDFPVLTTPRWLSSYSGTVWLDQLEAREVVLPEARKAWLVLLAERVETDETGPRIGR